MENALLRPSRHAVVPLLHHLSGLTFMPAVGLLSHDGLFIGGAQPSNPLGPCFMMVTLEFLAHASSSVHAVYPLGVPQFTPCYDPLVIL